MARGEVEAQARPAELEGQGEVLLAEVRVWLKISNRPSSGAIGHRGVADHDRPRPPVTESEWRTTRASFRRSSPARLGQALRLTGAP